MTNPNRVRPRLGLFLLCLGFAVTGCSTTITNLTPSQLPRSAGNLYPFEVAFDSNQRTIRDGTIEASVLIGLESFSMQPTPLIKNRWETVVPIPPNQEFINYRYKFDYKYNSIPEPKVSSKLSPTYLLEIVDR